MSAIADQARGAAAFASARRYCALAATLGSLIPSELVRAANES
jgi:hypothetical protein